MDETDRYRKFAIFLHSRFCHWSHADNCSWYYEAYNDESPRKGTEEDLWKLSAHKQWFETACQVYNKAVGIFAHAK